MPEREVLSDRRTSADGEAVLGKPKTPDDLIADARWWLRELGDALPEASPLFKALVKAVRALEKIAAVEDTQLRCVRHGGERGADDPDTCWCGIALDAADKARAVAREALNGGQQG